ncbi:MAG TPA: methyltransferase domain-containing protein [Acidobacteriaceae bacterium]
MTIADNPGSDSPITDRDRWNAKFLAGEAQLSEPDPFLIEACSALPPGRALDLAGGAGRHSLWLAQRGWTVNLADVSDEGVARARQRFGQAGVSVALRRESAADTLAWAREGHRFDLILVFLFLLREHFAELPALLAPGGHLLYKTYTADHARFQQGHSLRFALRPGELRTAFPSLNTLLDRETNGIAELLAQRPGA